MCFNALFVAYLPQTSSVQSVSQCKKMQMKGQISVFVLDYLDDLI